MILHVDRKLPIVHVNEWFHVGSKNEKPGRTGFAHLFEHMMFQGSKNARARLLRLRREGRRQHPEGGVNGTTNNDRTNYFATVPSGNLENLLWLEVGSAGHAARRHDAGEARRAAQRRQERAAPGTREHAVRPWFPLMFAAAFPTGHPYSWPVIGSQEDLSAATLDDVKEFFRQYYSPNNLSLVIAGDFDPAEAKRLVQKYFGDIPPGRALDRPARWVPTLQRREIVEVSDHVSLERVYIGWPTPRYFGPDDAALDIAARILADGLSSRLNKTLVYDQQLATAVASFNITGRDRQRVRRAGHGAARACLLSKIEPIVTAEITRLAKEGPDRRGARARQDQAGVRVHLRPRAHRRVRRQGGRVEPVQHLPRHPDEVDADLQRYRALTPADVQQAVVAMARHTEPRDRCASIPSNRRVRPMRRRSIGR